jgi:serine/threonine-protein kinase
MLPRVALDERAKRLFLRELETTRALNHPNVVRLRDGGCTEGTFFLTLEYCDGGTVDGLIRQRGSLPVPEAVDIVLQALTGLDYAHNVELSVKLKDGSTKQARGLVHRDLKPQNLFLSNSAGARVVKVGDYGLAKAFDLAGLSGLSCTSETAGTPVFMPRQQVIDYLYAKPEVDVWAMAATLYVMLTGQPPRDFVKGKDPWQVVLQSDALPILKRNATLPRRLAEIIDTALIDRPEIHFKTAAEFRRALENAV